MEKCFCHKTYFPGTPGDVNPRFSNDFSRRFRFEHSRSCRTSILMNFSENSHAALDLQVGGSNKKQRQRKQEKIKQENNKSKVVVIKHIQIVNKMIDK